MKNQLAAPPLASAPDPARLQEIARQVRLDIVEMLYRSGSGHLGGSLSAADILVALFFAEMRVRPNDPCWPDRQPRGVTNADLGVVVATLGVNAFVVWYERRRGRQLGSAFLLADAAHTGSDILVTLLAVASLALARVDRPWIDAVLAITVALIIAWSGFEVLRQSIPVLVDERAIDATRLRTVVLGVADIRDVRNVRSRSTASGQLFAEVTIAVAGTTPVDAAHRLADAVEAAIEREFGTSQVTVHVEPV